MSYLEQILLATIILLYLVGGTLHLTAIQELTYRMEPSDEKEERIAFISQHRFKYLAFFLWPVTAVYIWAVRK